MEGIMLAKALRMWGAIAVVRKLRLDVLEGSQSV